MRPRGPLLADDTNHLDPGQVRAGPLAELLGNRPVEDLVRWRPGPDHVGIEVAEDGRLNDRLHARLIAPGDKQYASGGWIELPNARQQLRPGRVLQPLAGEHETDLALAVAELTQGLERLLSRPGGDDPVVSPVALTQLGLHASACSRTVRQQHNRLTHQAPIVDSHTNCNRGGCPWIPVTGRFGARDESARNAGE